jgi:hypothetical protein
VSNARGDYLLRRVSNAPVVLLAAATGYAEGRVAVAVGGDQAQTRVDVQLEPGDGAAGQVLDPNGRGQRAAEVRCIAPAEGDEAPAAPPTATATSDDHGRFELPATAAGCQVVASYVDFAPSKPRPLELGVGNRLTLQVPASISGVVTDAEGQPPRAFTVTIEGFTRADGSRAHKAFRHTFANPTGRFRLSQLEAGRYVLGIRASGFPPVQSQPIDLKVGQQLRAVHIALP